MDPTVIAPVDDLAALLRSLVAGGERVLVLVDGPPCAGKTTMAMYLGDVLPATVFHLDTARCGMAPDFAWIECSLVAPFVQGRRVTVNDRSGERKVRSELILLLEGVQAFDIQADRIRVVRIWVAADPEVRATRLAERPYGEGQGIEGWAAASLVVAPAIPGLIVVDGTEPR